MIYRGTMVIHSQSLPKMDRKTWMDGAFFGELPVCAVSTARCRLSDTTSTLVWHTSPMASSL